MTGKSFGRKSVRRKLLLSVVPLAAGLAMASGPALASADTTVGQTPAPQRVWTQNLQLVSSGAIVPAGGGTITSLQTRSGTAGCPATGIYNLQVLRPEGNYTFLILGDTGNKSDPCDGQVHSYAVNIPVQAGDVLGAYVVSYWDGSLYPGSTGYDYNFPTPEAAPGQTVSAYPGIPGGGVDESATLVTDSDLTLSKPSDVAVNATSPAGAVVNYTNPTSSDENPSTVTVGCVPGSGSTFAIGNTTVTCTATDTDGDSNSPVSQTFNVSVKGAADQLTALRNAVQGVGPGTSLTDKIASVQSYLAARDSSDACATLALFINQVKAQTGKSISAALASVLIADAQRIEAVIPCTS